MPKAPLPLREILEIIERDGKATPAQIAQLTGVSRAKITALIAELEQSGVIRKYKGVINWDKAGIERVFAFIEVKISPERGVGFDAVARRLYRFDEVHSVYLMSGAYDLQVVVEGANMKEVAYFVAEKLAPLEHVVSTATHFVLKPYKIDGNILESEEEPERLSVTP